MDKNTNNNTELLGSDTEYNSIKPPKLSVQSKSHWTKTKSNISPAKLDKSINENSCDESGTFGGKVKKIYSMAAQKKTNLLAIPSTENKLNNVNNHNGEDPNAQLDEDLEGKNE